MESQFLSLLDVNIAFDQSHLFFPRLVTYVLLGLLAIILISKSKKIYPALRQAGRAVLYAENGFDRLRFFGTLVLIIAYFYMMSVVGDVFPNTGYGFLFVSIPFIFLLATLYVEIKSRRNMLIIAINAVVAPVLAWYVLSQLFRITLP
ncbi:tripartite tricarboxylate transporter TctB family protein [Halomonas sp. HP20-15]|uniref:tripartite tricarboxylate transporter TctB family protein n=1 Tax=Halomonas sp. HP20-15 TaxID=3085901 RepID=UPI002981741F|nr:tripartite tricarboxylate transporter TctB family protein [Halomonas sp. HP20-15]MDW5377559.1 tripartite tricarboxylate transporter TctB family protein [Halomonas sp. HP20-15]